jgi:hypothetical protein
MAPQRLCTAAAAGGVAGVLAAGTACLLIPPSLGTLLAELALAATITPYLLVTTPGRPIAVATAVGMALGLAGGPLWLAAGGHMDLPAALSTLAVLAAWACGLAGLTSALRWCRLPPALPAALVSLAAVAWLAWPVWLAPWLTGPSRERTVARLVAAHPLFALNGTGYQEPWSQRPLAYNLTNIGDDIAYELPHSAWACVLAHALLAAGLAIGPTPGVNRTPAGAGHPPPDTTGPAAG